MDKRFFVMIKEVIAGVDCNTICPQFIGMKAHEYYDAAFCDIFKAVDFAAKLKTAFPDGHKVEVWSADFEWTGTCYKMDPDSRKAVIS